MMIMEIGGNKRYTKLIKVKHDEWPSGLDTLPLSIVSRVILIVFPDLLQATRTEQHESLVVVEPGFN